MSERPCCIFILSTRSAGSSALQRKLQAQSQTRSLTGTRHVVSDRQGRRVSETLYWTKVASVLELPQLSIPNSEVPIPRRRARREISSFLEANGVALSPQTNEERAYFEAWDDLCGRDRSDLIEKSPHHLYQREAVGLMERYACWTRRVDVRFVGLVRNPMDTLYSSWRRFGIAPQREESHWIRAYQILLDLQARHPERVEIVRYEAMAAAGQGRAETSDSEFHAASLARWRGDAHYGFDLSAEARVLARRLGYDTEELHNPSARAWFWRREPRALAYRMFAAAPATVRAGARARVRRWLAGSSSGRGQPR